ncbi:MAG: AEC family transporter [Oscillospiraceae bacterium]|nr:AEC family transporter [Oscillospiraceae bacterium]
MTALNIGLELALLMVIGFFIRKIKLLPDNFESSVSKLILNVTLPCLIIRSLNIEFDPSQLLRLVNTVLVSVGTIIFLFLLGQFGYYICRRSSTGRIVRFGVMFSNYTFVGVPMIETLYGSSGLFIFTIFTLPVRLIYYISPQFLLRSKEARRRAGGSGSVKDRLKGIFSPPIVSVLVGLVIYFCGIKLPYFVSEVVRMVASVSSPLGMIVCGMILAQLDIKELLKSRRILYLVASRLVIAPLVELLVLMVLGLDTELIKVAVIYAGLPTASLLPTFALQYEDDPHSAVEGSVGVFLTTVLCIVTLPIWAAVVERVLG